MPAVGVVTDLTFLLPHIGDDGDTVIADAATAEEITDIIVGDLMASDVRRDLPDEDREDAFRAFVAMTGPDEQIEIFGRTYRIEELPDDPAALDEFWTVRLASPSLIFRRSVQNSHIELHADVLSSARSSTSMR